MSPCEDDITRWFWRQRHLEPEDFPIGIGDDMAEVMTGQGGSVLITTDMLLDGTHFDLQKATLEQVGYKAMAASLSDCAAMATVPLAAVAAVAMPPGLGSDQLKQLHAGIVRAADRYHCPLIGGDITAWKVQHPLAIDVTMLSRRGNTRPVQRTGALPGDALCVTGALGGSKCGRHLDFEPRVHEALALTETVHVHAMIDISDGLSTDLNRICRQSCVGALIEAASVPISEDARRADDPLQAALHDGEDFELLFALSPEDAERLLRSWRAPVPVTRIGTIVRERSMLLHLPDGQLTRLTPGGYDHLARPDHKRHRHR
jgi:thiamine-monophosphate kinase